MRRATLFTLAPVCATLVLAGMTPAAASCVKLDFSVNDFGKEGPARDAKKLLDKKIIQWAKLKGIKTYTVGKKDVSCKLYLHLIVAEEHTCTATAQVCWN